MPNTPIKHVFVLMLENRSFDHFFAFSGIPGLSPVPTNSGFNSNATDKAAVDPPHEYDHVKVQINNGSMNGFTVEGMKGCKKPLVKVLHEIATNALLIDNWFSSMPGPTWPNRLFAHAASSGGLDNSLRGLDPYDAVTKPQFSFEFDRGHIFDQLTRIGKRWRIYHGDAYPQVLSLEGMVAKRGDVNFFRKFATFDADMKANDAAAYTFIEPNYAIRILGESYVSGNSQHPRGTISKGEELISAVYNSIFLNKVGESSVLLITWDEHGGIYDHVRPPSATPPGDHPRNHDRAKSNKRDCKFDTFGVRVPAIIISPWLPVGLGSNSKFYGPNTFFDHSSIVRGLRSTFSILPELTNRDRDSPDWNSLLLAAPRPLMAKVPKIAKSKFKYQPPVDGRISKHKGTIDGNLIGTVQIALAIDWAIAEETGVAPLASTQFAKQLRRIDYIVNGDAAVEKNLSEKEIQSAYQTLMKFLTAVEIREYKVNKAKEKATKKN